MLAAVSDNWMPLVVRAATERMHVQGFRFDQDQQPRAGGLRRLLRGAAPASTGDRDAWTIWQRNGLDVESGLAFQEAAKHGESYLLVWFDDEDDTKARITVEHPAQVVVRRAAGDRRRRTSALKKWQEDDGSYRATLWTPKTIYRYQRQDGKPWTLLVDNGTFTNTLGVVPVIPIVNDPQMRPSRVGARDGPFVGLGRSDLIDVIPTQDSINKLVCDMLVASEVSAFRQRWATGLEIPEDENGNAIEPFNAAVDRLFVSEDEKTRFGDFNATDLRNFVVGIENRLQSLSSRSRTPPHYLNALGGTLPSGEALKSAETGLVSKTHDKMRAADDPIEEAIRLALRIEENAAAEIVDAEVIWSNAESRSESEWVDSLVKKLAFGVPVQQLWEDAGYSPQQINRFAAMIEEYAQMAQTIPTPAGAGSQGVPNEPAPPATTPVPIGAA